MCLFVSLRVYVYAFALNAGHHPYFNVVMYTGQYTAKEATVSDFDSFVAGGYYLVYPLVSKWPSPHPVRYDIIS